MTSQKIEQNMNYYRKNNLQTTFTPCQLVRSKQLDTKQTKKNYKNKILRPLQEPRKSKKLTNYRKQKFSMECKNQKLFQGSEPTKHIKVKNTKNRSFLWIAETKKL